MSKGSKMEFRVWCENGDLIAECDTWGEALAKRNEAVNEHLETVHDARNGSGETCDCGVLHYAGYFVQAVQDDVDVTDNYALYGGE